MWLCGCAGLVAAGLAGWAFRGSRVDPEAQRRVIAEAIGQQRWAEAEERLARWLEQFPADGNAWVRLGWVRRARGESAGALAAFRHVRDSDAAWAQAQDGIGEVYLAQNQAPEAERAFWAAAERDPRGMEPRRRLAALLTIEQRPEEAHAVLAELYRLTRDAQILATQTGLAILGIDDVDSLEPALERFVRQSPSDAWLRRARGIARLHQGRLAEALPDLEDVVRLDDDLAGRFALAECRIALGQAEGLEAVLGPLPTRPADQAQWWFLAGQAAETLGRHDEAITHWRRAVAADPTDRAANYRLGQALAQHGDEAAARPYLDRASMLGSRQRLAKSLLSQLGTGGQSAEPREMLGAVCIELGLPVEARGWYEEAVRVDPARASAQTALARLPRTAPPRPAGPRRAAVVHAAPARAPAPPARMPVLRFEEIAHRAGLNYQYASGATADLFIADTMGGGVGLIDYDADGWLDVYLVNGCALPVDRTTPPAPNVLFHNRGDGTFEDVTARAGVGGRGYGMGCAVGDYDNDGHDDLFVTGFGDTVLYRNRGDGTFEDVTARAGVRSSRWSTAAGFGDLDGDGDLDLVVITYVDADPATPIPCRDGSGHRIHCTPGYYHGQPDHLFRNNGDGTFADVAQEAGFDAVDGVGLGLGLAIADLDGDGRLDVFVANDAAPNFFYRNLGGLHFEEIGVKAGLAYDGEGRATASMGVVADDLDQDGRPDVFHTNLIREASTLARNLGEGRFVDVTAQAGLAAPSRTVTGFGALALDADNDGRLDLFAANGHVDDRPWQDRPMAELPHLYRSIADGHFERVETPAPAAYFTTPIVGRGAAVGDLDNDGRPDLVVVHRDAPLAVLRNTTDAGHSLGLRLRGTVSGSTPVGARVTCRAGGRTMVRWLTSGTGYLSVSDPRLWFGLGSSRMVDSLEIHWPSGAEQKWSNVAGDRILEIREAGEPVEVRGWAKR